MSLDCIVHIVHANSGVAHTAPQRCLNGNAISQMLDFSLRSMCVVCGVSFRTKEDMF